VRLLLFLVLSLIALGLVAAVPVSAMMLLMSPEACVDRPVTITQDDSDHLQELIRDITSGELPEDAQVTLNEAQLSSRLAEILADKDAPVEDVRVHLCPEGYAEVAGTVSQYGMDVDVLVRGDVEVSGDRVVIRVLDTEVGGLPLGVTDSVANEIVEEIMREHDLQVIDVGVRLQSVEVGDGYVTITGQAN
jgi:hypothetical protein